MWNLLPCYVSVFIVRASANLSVKISSKCFSWFSPVFLQLITSTLDHNWLQWVFLILINLNGWNTFTFVSAECSLHIGSVHRLKIGPFFAVSAAGNRTTDGKAFSASEWERYSVDVTLIVLVFHSQKSAKVVQTKWAILQTDGSGYWHKYGPRVKTALRLPPSAQAENQFSALFPGKRAEIYCPLPFRPFSGETGGNYKIRPWKRCKKSNPNLLTPFFIYSVSFFLVETNHS